MLDDKIKSFVNGCGSIVIKKYGGEGYAFNEAYASPFLIRPETIEKIKKLLYDDLMFTCEENNNELCQDIPNNNLISFIEMNEIWKKYINNVGKKE